ncbi:MAG: SCO family protein [Solirubrobacteraceae bacterium]
MSQQRKRLLLAAATGLLAFWAIGLLALANRDEPSALVTAEGDRTPFRGGTLPAGILGAPAPRVDLADARDGRVDTADLKGRPYVLTFLYVNCDDVCPLIAVELKQALKLLGARAKQVTALAVSADPEGDTRSAVRRWLTKLRMPDNFRYLTGTAKDLQPVWRDHYAAPQPRGNPNSAHSASIWLIDRRGRWRTKFSGGVPVRPADIAHDLRILLDEPAA